jgi:hypothetical protein
VVAGRVTRPEVVLRSRAELDDPAGRVRKNAFHAARSLQPDAGVELIEAAERIATKQAELAIAGAVREAAQLGALVRSCAVVTGASGQAPLESILKSHALVHAAEGRLYQHALLRAAASCGLDAIAVPKRSIRDHGEIDQLRRELGAPWAEDQKLAALAAWRALQ